MVAGRELRSGVKQGFSRVIGGPGLVGLVAARPVVGASASVIDRVVRFFSVFWVVYSRACAGKVRLFHASRLHFSPR